MHALAHRILIGWLVWTLSPAIALADDVDVSVVDKAFHGQSRPSVALAINRAVSQLEVTLKGADGVVQKHSARGLAAGSVERMELRAPLGPSTFAGQLSVTFVDGSGGSMALQFSVEVIDRFVVIFSEGGLDLESQRIEWTLNRPAGRCEYEVEIDERAPRKGSLEFDGAGAGVPLRLNWKAYGVDDVVLRIRLQCWDASEAFHTDPFETYPWRLEIPHEDIQFATGRFQIAADQEPKLEAALAHVHVATRRYASRFPLKLFVSGHTDTVGVDASNRQLSSRRAAAISNWFRKHGVAIPISYVGMGEAGLAVATADEVAEARNRRARYIVGMTAPSAAAWSPL